MARPPPIAAPQPASPQDWPCLDAARLQRQFRLPIELQTGLLNTVIGSLAWDNLPALWAVAPDWPGLADALARPPGDRARLGCPSFTPSPDWARTLDTWHRRWQSEGRIRAWREEAFAWFGPDGAPLVAIERAAARFWGALTLGAHGNGYLADAHGRPTHLWLARRAWDKATDPGRLDNLVGGGVPLGQSPSQALRREAWEEAGLTDRHIVAWACGSTLAIDADVPEGRQWEWLYVFDLAVPEDWTPVNQDGEVAEHLCLPVAEALALAASGEMTTDASLATLDLALRHGLLPAQDARRLAVRLQALRVPPAQAMRHDAAWTGTLFNFPETGPQSG